MHEGFFESFGAQGSSQEANRSEIESVSTDDFAFWNELHAERRRMIERLSVNDAMCIKMPMAELSVEEQLENWGQRLADRRLPAVTCRKSVAAWFLEIACGL